MLLLPKLYLEISSVFLFPAQLASWEEGIAQARTACEAWRKEADEATRKHKLAEQTKEEVLYSQVLSLCNFYTTSIFSKLYAI